MPDYVAPEKRKPLQGLLHKRQVCRGGAAPSCLRKTALWLKSPTGAFIAAQTPIPPFHSLFSGELWFLFAPMARCAAFGVIGTAQSAKEKQKRDMQLDHLRAPIFVFIRKTASPSPSSLRDATSPKVRGFGITEKHFGFARGSPPWENCRAARCLRGFTSRSPPADGTLLPRRL